MTVAWGADLQVGPTRPHPTLGSALAVAVPGDRIRVDAGIYEEDTDLLQISGIEIAGAGSDPVTGTVFTGGDGPSQWLVDGSDLVFRDLVLDGGGDLRALTLQQGAVIEAWNLRIQNGSHTSGAGISVDDSTLALHDSVVYGNSTTGNGGGMLILNGGVVTADGCRFTGNHANAEGGAIRVGTDSTLVLTRASVLDNTASAGAGVACNSAARCTVEDAVFEGNASVEGGGGLYAFQVDEVRVLRTAFCGNTASTTSGGHLTLMQTLTALVRNSSFLDGEAAVYGGGLFVRDTTLALENDTFLGDRATTRGGAFFQDGSTTTRSVNNLFLESGSDVAPFAAVDIVSGTVTSSYDLFWGNLVDRFPALLPTDIVDLDPLVARPATCVTPEPLSGSPTFDAGDPAILDPDGSRSDLGATGGPDAIRDRDGDGTTDDLDCNDADPEQGPDLPELCDGDDDDCDGLVDEGCATDAPIDRGPVTGEGGAAEPGCACTSAPSGSGWLLLGAPLLAVLQARLRAGRSRRV